jgi:hypothetical protein
MDLIRLRRIIFDAADEICTSVNDGAGVVTAVDMVNALKDASQHWDDSVDQREGTVAVYRLHMEMQQNRRFLMESLMSDEASDIWTMQISQVRRQAMGQSVWKLLTTINDNEDWLLLTTKAVSNGAVMESLMQFFQVYPAAAREWGYMIRAILVLLWCLSCDDDWESVTGEEALELWEGVTQEVNTVLPPQARLHARYSYEYPMHT